jgi:glutathione S-transferase
LCTQFPVADNWFPKDARHRAKVDEYLAWQHLNLRMFGSMMFQSRVSVRAYSA